MQRITVLDGWRGVAILMVLAEHAAWYGRFHRYAWATLGSLGVDIFFVLSGYIITARLLEEESVSGKISLRSFYVRRVVRILPPTVLYLAILCLLPLFMRVPDLKASQVVASLMFARNYLLAAQPGAGLSTGHFWSLSIEEQFYVLWPAILVLSGRRPAIWIAVAGAAASGAWRVYAYTHSLVSGLVLVRTECRCDGLLIGCILALLLSRQGVRSFVERNCPKETSLILATLLMILPETSLGFPTLRGYLLIAGMIGCTLSVREGLAYKWLTIRPLIWIGRISFSLYIWQQLFLVRPAFSGPQFGKLGYFPFNLICVFVVAAGSFYFVEKPVLARFRPARPVIPSQDILQPCPISAE